MFSILIVDDNPNDRKGITGLINWNELDIHVVGTAINGLDGYEKALQWKPDFVLTDVAMPTMDGVEMTNRIKEQLPNTKFIFMSCFDDVEYLQSAINLEVSAYILKPIDLNELLRAIKKMKAVRVSEMDKQESEAAISRLLDESLPLLQEQFIKELFHTEFSDEDVIKDRGVYLKMNFSYVHYVVLSAHIDNYDLIFSNVSIERKHYTIYNLHKTVENYLFSNMSGYAINENLRSITGIIFFTEEDLGKALDQLTERVNCCIEEINQKLSLEVTLGISPFAQKLAQAAEMYRNAEYAAKSKFYSKGNRMIFFAEVKEPEKFTQYNLQEIKQEISAIVEEGEGNAETFVQKYYKRGTQYTEKYSKSLAYSIIHILQTILIEHNQSLSELFDDDVIIWQKLAYFETIPDLERFLINIINGVKETLGKSEKGGYSRIVADIKSIIDQRYAEIENISQVVEDIYLSASHANLIFKQQTGQTIFDYLTYRRMEVAKEMLRDPYIKVYEIPEKIGYKTNAHFRAVFKDFTGQTPRQYQDKQLR